MSDPRSYSVGLPVTVTVHDDGTVTYWVDTSEADTAIWENIPDPEDAQPGDDPIPDEDTMVADQTRIGADHERRFAEGRQSL